MSSFRSNLNSVSSTHDGLTAIQSRLTTCFKHFRHKLFKVKEQPYPEINSDDYSTYFQKYQQKFGSRIKWCQQNYKDSGLLQKANDNLREFSATLKRFISKRFRFPKGASCDQSDWRTSEIVTKLLSTNFVIAPIDITASTSISTASKTASSIEMTITGNSFLVIREEYPDLDAEIRSILMSRAQNGATIAEIKEDYRKNTGLRFPVYEHITDFLLCIPGVTAYCNERGTRIFNVRPTEKTKHIYDLVTQQKAPSERYSTASNRHHGHNQYRRDSDVNSNYAVPGWRTGTFNRPTEQVPCLSGSLMSSSFKNHLNLQQSQQYLIPPHSVDENNSRSESDGFVENRGGYYQDNCQYLFNRIYNYENKKETMKENPDCNYNNIDINLNEHAAITENHLGVQIEMQGNLQTDQNNKDMHIFKRPIGRALRGTVGRASSPDSRTRSSQRSDSIYSSDFDYEAHLLDFPLLGDDFLLYLARMELRCKFRKHQKVLQSGLCVSGQTIKAAARRMRSLPCNAYANRRIIVNIGSVDIMQGRPLVQIEHDFRNLISVINKRGFQPILTTLAPLANFAHDTTIKMKLERFNEFIKREGQFLLVVDIWARFVNERKQTLFDCYQNEPRQVTGAQESYVFWNKIGRQRVLQLIESNLEY